MFRTKQNRFATFAIKKTGDDFHHRPLLLGTAVSFRKNAIN